jgi:DNA-binding CsgD family transcriptional regulator
MDSTLDLIGLIYDAVAGRTVWSEFLRALTRATSATLGSLTLIGPEADRHQIVCWYGWSDGDYRLYAERYALLDPWATGSLRLDEGIVGNSEDLCSREELEESAAYREFYAPRGCDYGCGGTILRTPNSLSFVIVARKKSAGAFGEKEKAVLRPLMPHLKRAALLHGELMSLRSQLAAFSGHLDRYPQAFLLIDDSCRVLYMNSAAREIAGQRDGVTVEAGRLIVMKTPSDAAIVAAVRQMASDRASAGQRVEISRPSGRKPYRLLLMPLPQSGAVPLGVMQPVVAALIVDVDSPPQADPLVLKELFSLTPAEARVTALLIGGNSLDEVASELCVSLETIRTHMRRVLAKTATHRQGELISLVLRTVPFRPV